VRVRFSAEAAEELGAATAWYDTQRRGLGLVFIDAVEAAVDLVARYNLPYLVLDDHVRVLAVAHDRRRPRYWAPRVRSSG
jgi:hypothetical protein